MAAASEEEGCDCSLRGSEEMADNASLVSASSLRVVCPEDVAELEGEVSVAED